MAVSAGTIFATLELRDKMTAQIQAAASQLKKFGAGAEEVGGKMRGLGTSLTLGVTVPLTAATTAALKFSSDFENVMTRVGSLTSLGADAVEDLSQKVIDLAPKVGVGPKPLGEALLVVASTGLDAKNSMEVLEMSAKATAVGLGETKDVARSVTAAMTAYGKQNLDASEATNKLFVAVREGGAEASEFAGSLGRVIGIASQVGVSFDEVLASMATFTRLGVDADEAATALRGTMSALLNPSAAAKEALDKMNMTIDDLRRSVREKGLAEAMIDLVKATKGNEEALTDIIPNVRALAGILGTAGSQAGAYADVLSNVKGATNEADEAFEIMSHTLGFKWNQALAQAQTILIQFGDALAPTAIAVLEGLKPVLSVVSELSLQFGRLPDNIRTAIIIFGALAAVVGPAVFVMGSLTMASGQLASILALLAGAQTTANAAMMAGGAQAAKNIILYDAYGVAVAGAGAASSTAAVGVTVFSGAAAKAAFALGAIGIAIGTIMAAIELNKLDAFKKLHEAFARYVMTSNDGMAAVYRFIGGIKQMTPAAAEAALAQSRAADAARAAAPLIDVEAEAYKNLKDQMTGVIDSKNMENLAKLAMELANTPSPTGGLDPATLRRIGQAALAAKEQGAKLPPVLENIVNALAIMKKNAEGAGSGLKKLTDEQKAIIEKGLKDLEKAERDSRLRRNKEQDEAGVQLLKRAEDFHNWMAQMTAMKANIETQRRHDTYVLWAKQQDRAGEAAMKALEDNNKRMEEIERNTGFGAILRKSFDAIPGILANAFTGGGGMQGAAKAIGSTVGATVGSSLVAGMGKTVVENGNKVFKQGSGMMKNLDIAGAVGGAFAAAIPVIGAMVGPAIQGLMKLFGDHTGKDLKKMGKQWGVNLSEGLLDQLKADAKKFGGEVQAMAMNLDKIIGEAGGVKAFGLDKSIAKTRDLFSLIETKALTATQAASQLEKMFGLLLPEAIDKTTGIASAGFLDLIDNARRFGTEIKTVTEFLQQQASAVTGGLNKIAAGSVGVWNTAVAGAGETAKKLSEAKDKVAELTAQIADMEKKGPGNEKQRVQLQQWKAELSAAKDEVARLSAEQDRFSKALLDAGANGQATFDRVGRLASVAFTAAIASGKGFLETLDSMAPTLDAMEAAQKKFGFTTNATATELLKFREFARNNRELIDGLDGVNKMMSGLHNMGMLTQDAFNDLTGTAADTFQKMVDGGLSGNQAMAFMQPTLQTIWKLHKDTGLALDENTAKLLADAEAAGIVGDAHRTEGDRMVTAMEGVRDILSLIAEWMGVKLPQAAATASSAIVREMDKAKTAVGDVADEATRAAEGSSPGGFRGVADQALRAGSAVKSFGSQALGVMKSVAKDVDSVASKIGKIKPPAWLKGATAKDWFKDLSRDKARRQATDFGKERLDLKFAKEDEVERLKSDFKEKKISKEAYENLLKMINEKYAAKQAEINRREAEEKAEIEKEAAEEAARILEEAARTLEEAQRELALEKASSEYEKSKLQLGFDQADAIAELMKNKDALGALFDPIMTATLERFAIELAKLEEEEKKRLADEAEKKAKEQEKDEKRMAEIKEEIAELMRLAGGAPGPVSAQKIAELEAELARLMGKYGEQQPRPGGAPIPQAADGGQTRGEGLVNMHPNELITPATDIEDLLAEVAALREEMQRDRRMLPHMLVTAWKDAMSH